MRSTETCDWRDSQVMHGPWIGEPTGEEGRHFFFRFKDETFECDAHRLDFQGSCGFDMTDARTVS